MGIELRAPGLSFIIIFMDYTCSTKHFSHTPGSSVAEHGWLKSGALHGFDSR